MYIIIIALLAKILKVDYSEIAKVWLVKFLMFIFKIIYLAHFSSGFDNLFLELKECYVIEMEEILSMSFENSR